MNRNPFRESIEICEAILDEFPNETEWRIIHIAKDVNNSPTINDTNSSKPFLYIQDESIRLLRDFGAFETGEKAKWFIQFVDPSSRYDKVETGYTTDSDNITRACRNSDRIFIEEANYIEDKQTNGLYAFLVDFKLLRKYLRHAQRLMNLRDYWYENGQLKFMLVDGEIDQLDFSKADLSRKLFETFFTLWKSDGNGEYTPNQIIQMFNKLFHAELEANRIGEIVSNIRPSILNKKPTLSNRVEWKFNKKKACWIFKISPRNPQSY